MPKSTTTKARSKPVKRPKKRGRKVTKRGLLKRLDMAFSWYMRLRFSDEDGTCECYTCGKKDHWTRLQNGHFISRKHYKTRWRSDNCRPQCYGCNITRSGEQWLFGKRLDQEYGQGHTDKIYRLSRQKYQPTHEEYEKWIDYYESHVAAILARRVERNRREHSTIPARIIERIHIH